MLLGLRVARVRLMLRRPGTIRRLAGSVVGGVMLSFAHLEALIAIAELGSFRAAAKRLGDTQPTVSMRIGELEHSLDTRLFDRSSYRPQLTADGREILKYAQRMMLLMHEMRACALNGAGVVGTIRLGAADSFALTCLPSLLARLEHGFPRLKVALDIDYSFNLNRKLHRGELDVAFLTSPTTGPDVRIEPLVPIPLVWVASPRLGLPESRLAPAESGVLRVLETEPPIEPHELAIAVRSAPTSPDLSPVLEIAREIVARSDLAVGA